MNMSYILVDTIVLGFRTLHQAFRFSVLPRIMEGRGDQGTEGLGVLCDSERRLWVVPAV